MVGVGFDEGGGGGISRLLCAFSFFPPSLPLSPSSGRKYASDGPLAPAQCGEGRSGPGSLSRITVISTGSALQALRLLASLPPHLQRNPRPKSAPGRNLCGLAVGPLDTEGDCQETEAGVRVRDLLVA